MLRKHQRIKALLETCDRTDLLPYERKKLESDIEREIIGIWGSDELRRQKPTPIEEAISGMAMVESVLWNAVPQYLRKLDDAVRKVLGQPLPLLSSPLKFASWMGGDRDGNPNVTPEITLEVSHLSRWTASTLLKEDIKQLHARLSLTKASSELLDALSTGQFARKLEEGSVRSHSREPYREILSYIESRIEATIEHTSNELSRLQNLKPVGTKRINHPAYKDSPLYTPISSALSGAKPLTSSDEIVNPLLLIHRSLVETGHSVIAEGYLSDVLRKIAVFGLALLPMDIRQESTRHTEALDAITKFLGMETSYSSWDENKRREWLQQELSSKRPLLPRHRSLSSFGFSDTVLDTLGTFDVIANLNQDSLGAYVISQCQQASDVLAVRLLQQDAGVEPPLRVVPLFETLDDLQRSGPTVEALFSMPVYRNNINNIQEVMVGYSDSAKDAGRIAASWAQYKAQETVAKIAEKHNVTLTFFHGKGGTVGRGGNPECKI
jgi:phosphoenolpyruvate carboxylase